MESTRREAFSALAVGGAALLSGSGNAAEASKAKPVGNHWDKSVSDSSAHNVQLPLGAAE